ncbi:uncharacterized protein [Lepeophtheirus salmonis]|uniref:uncharacterized protein isoform X2 n=1 Tax=Lepeophtheirus salmonis TaxID=72036 RepID=UPI001AE8E645|nr:uncharacterized protein LOC121114613 isoform X2 [Lepeophtheirus salmonis]
MNSSMNNLLGSKFLSSEVLTVSDKRCRNPNWTDHEIVRFLEILQEEDTMKDLMAQRNKQVFCYVAQRLCSEGANKTWDQCRIKLKNLKSQYRYVKDRVPNLDILDLEDEKVVKKLILDCQGRGISSASIKHLKYLKKFICKQNLLEEGDETISYYGTTSVTPTIIEDDPISSSPSSPKDTSNGTDNADEEPKTKKRKCDSNSMSSVQGEIQNAYRFIENFNKDMMEQFMEQQRKSQSSFLRWEQERFRLEQQAMERWRQEARDHEKQLFGMFCHVMTQCNSAFNTILKAAQAVADSTPNNDNDA